MYGVEGGLVPCRLVFVFRSKTLLTMGRIFSSISRIFSGEIFWTIDESCS